MTSNATELAASRWSDLWRVEDWWAVWFGFMLLIAVVAGVIDTVPKVGQWTVSPLDSMPATVAIRLIFLACGLAALTGLGVAISGGGSLREYSTGFAGVFILAVVAYLFAGQTTVREYGLGYALWALVLGLLISNTVGAPAWLRAGARSELFIKTGLVLLGAEILFGNIVSLGPPGLLVAWVVTPLVIISMYYFGVRWLQIRSKALIITIAAATSVCGVSAAIAAAAASGAKREELSLAVAITMAFTVIMMIALPAVCRLMELDPVVAGAWIGGTVDATGAVVAAGAALGGEAETTAAVVKMVQNMLIGIIAFAITVYWVTVVERNPEGSRANPMEIWRRLPKFILGFVAASLIFSFALIPAMGGDAVAADLKVTKTFRSWFFCLAFVSIGLESNFRALMGQLERGKPLVLYVVGQTLNVVLTLAMAWLAFGVLYEVAK